MGWILNFTFAFIFFFIILLVLWYPLRRTIIQWYKKKSFGIPIEPEDPLPNKDFVERYPSKDEIDLKKDLEEERVVGLAEPVGFWTKKILSEKLQVLLTKLGDENAKLGYWQKLVLKQRSEPQSQAKSSSRSKPRR